MAQEAGLAADWLNNYNVIDNNPENVEDILQAEWQPVSIGLRYIDLSIATLETLTRSKILAADDFELTGRVQDVRDLIDLMESQGIRSAAEFASKYHHPFEDYPVVAKLVKDHFARKKLGDDR